MTEVKEQSTAEHPFRRAAAMTAASLAVLYGAAYFVGDHVSATPDVDETLQQQLNPLAIKLARLTLQANITRDGHIVVTKVDDGTAGYEIVSMDSYSFADSELLHVDASMTRDSHGQLDPTTTNDVDMTEMDCKTTQIADNKVRWQCGGKTRTSQEVEIIYGDNSTFTKGDWGIEGDLTPAGYNNPTIVLNTRTNKPAERSDTTDAQRSLGVAKVWSRVAKVWMAEALHGDVKVPLAGLE